MKYGSQYAGRKHSKATKLIENNLLYLSAKSAVRLLFTRPKNFQKLDLPLLVISGMQRSGTHLVDNLLRNHQQVLSYYKELQIGKPNKYHWPDLMDAKDAEARFRALLPRNMVKHFLDISRHENFVFDFAHFKRVFLKTEKDNSEANQRRTLDNFFTAYFAAYLNCNHSNFFDAYKYIVAPIPGLTIYRKSLEAFFSDYPDGKIFVSIREPYMWWNSARNHSERQKKYGLKRYKSTIDNTIWACREYGEKLYPFSFDHLIKDTEKSIKSILACAHLEATAVTSYPSNFPHYAIDNSTFGHSKTKTVLKEKVKRELRIPEDEKLHIKQNILPAYENIIGTYAINVD